MKVLGISGSLRKRSFNTALLRESVRLAPGEMIIEVVTLNEIPVYNGDTEAVGFPEPVLSLKKKIKESDAILIMSPEHNHSVPGVLKNAIDWVSRGENEFFDKPLAIGGGSDGIISTARMQTHLLTIANTLNLHAMNKPLFQVPNIDKKFDGELNLNDEKTKQKLKDFLKAFQVWIDRLS